MTQNTDPPRRLSPWNPLDHLRLLWWVLVTPQRLLVYREAFGEKDEHRIGRWQVSTFALLPLLLVTLALKMRTLPFGWDILPNVYPWIIVVLVVVWLFTALFGRRHTVAAGIGMGLLMIIMVLIAVLSIANGVTANTVSTTGRLIFIVMFVVMTSLMSSIVTAIEKNVQDSLSTGHPSWLAWGVFGLMLLDYAFLLCFSFLGGWQVFQ